MAPPTRTTMSGGKYRHPWIILLWCATITLDGIWCIEYGMSDQDRRRGALVGRFTSLQHNVSGTVYALDEETLFIEKFTYDANGPDASFWVGKSGPIPNPKGELVTYVHDNTRKGSVLPAFSGEDVIVHLPSKVRISEQSWFSVWCARFALDMGHVIVPNNLEVPRKRTLPEFSRMASGVRSGNITILDARTFYIPNLHYDGLGPDAYFWVGTGSKPDYEGFKIPNEKGSLEILREYEGEDIELQLPPEWTVYDIDYLGIWCVSFKTDFGHVLIPKDIWVPPALGQTKIKPLSWYSEENTQQQVVREFQNCKQLGEKLQVEWQAHEDEIHIRLTADIDKNQYVAFGLRPQQQEKVDMINSDLVVAYYDDTDGSYHAVDYSVTARSECNGVRGVCPDERVKGRNDAAVISGERRNGITTITFKRPYETIDQMDIQIPRHQEEKAIIAAIGTLNHMKEANYHSEFITTEYDMVDFKAIRDNRCLVNIARPPPKFEPWPVNILRGVNNFTFTIGPAGGERGYSAITEFDSWPVAWWVNGLLIPEIYVVRGETYHISVSGGTIDNHNGRHHPLYITENPEGGFGQKTPQEQDQERTYAGVEYSLHNMPHHTTEGPLCEWHHNAADEWKRSKTFQEYQDSLYEECEPGSPGVMIWTVQEDAPDLLYYQSYTYKYMGWKIHVGNQGEGWPGDNPNTASAMHSISSFVSGLIIVHILR